MTMAAPPLIVRASRDNRVNSASSLMGMIMKKPNKPSKRNAEQSGATYEGLRARIQGAPIGSKSDKLVQRLFKARGSLSTQEIRQLESLIAGRIANGELT